MHKALLQAKEARAAGEVPVGAVVVDPSGRILGSGQNACIRTSDCTAHAEIVALRHAGRTLGNYRLEGCLLIVTLEPCPMCASALIQARLSGVVFGAADRLCGAVVSCAEYCDPPCCRGHPLWHLGGVLGENCADLLRDFFAMRRGKE